MVVFVGGCKLGGVYLLISVDCFGGRNCVSLEDVGEYILLYRCARRMCMVRCDGFEYKVRSGA